MQNKSPLRYPGGKTRAIKILQSYVDTYYPSRKTLLSPFFGGGSFELSLQAKGYTVFGNDLFVPLYTFWKVAQESPEELVESVRSKMPITKEWFQHTRRTIRDISNELDVATAYYCINRTSFSGATFCGGFSQQASTGRLNESSLQTLGNVELDSITFSNKDCCEFIASHPETEDTLLYADPPYYISTYVYGKDGDMHEGFDHEKLAALLKTRKDWILSYNDCEYIRTLYAGCRFFTEKWAYGMNASKSSSEVIILP